jgi:hypothetical protein
MLSKKSLLPEAKRKMVRRVAEEVAPESFAVVPGLSKVMVRSVQSVIRRSRSRLVRTCCVPMSS